MDAYDLSLFAAVEILAIHQVSNFELTVLLVHVWKRHPRISDKQSATVVPANYASSASTASKHSVKTAKMVSQHRSGSAMVCVALANDR